MTIEEIKKQLSMSTVLAYYGLTVNKNKHINCPFHADKTPSMRVYEDSNTVYCFSGNCSTHGHSLDVIEFVRMKEKIDKHQAIMKCKELLGFVVQGKTSAQSIAWKLLRQSIGKSNKAKSYLKSRGLSHLGVGFNSGLLQKGKSAESIELAGLKDWGKHSVVYSLRNALGQVVSFYARSLTKGHFYQSGRAGLYPCYPKKNAKRIIITESIIDAHTLEHIEALKDYGKLALFGTNGLTKEHEKALQACRDLDEVYLMLDGDEAGRKASLKYQAYLSELLPGVSIKIVELPKDADVNELWANHLNEELFIELLNQVKSSKMKGESIEKQSSKLDTTNPNNLGFKGKYARFYIKGFEPTKNMDSLKVTVVCQTNEHKKYRGKVELYEDAAVQKYCKGAGLKLEVEPSYLDLDISLLTDELENYREQVEQQINEPENELKSFELSPKSKAIAQAFLKEQDLFPRLNNLIGKSGIVGEKNVRMCLLMVASSYKNEKTLHALIQGSSGSGKTLLLRKIMSFLPNPDAFIFTRVSDKSFYHAKDRYRHKCLAIEDWDGLSEDAQYMWREFQTGQELSSSITEKNHKGKMDTKEVLARGPISSLMCTTRGSIYEDNMNRCLLMAVDESEEQTQRILDYQYKKQRGEIDKKAEEKATKLLQNLVYLLQAKEVVNPYAGRLELPPQVHKIRRLNELFQSFVAQITWWHQYQRKTDEQGRIITEKQDLEIATKLLFDTIMLKVDELDGELRHFYERLKRFVLAKGGEKENFERREVRHKLQVRKSQLHRYIQALIDLDYIQIVGGFSNRGYKYQIKYWDDNAKLRAQIQAYLQEQLDQL